MQRRASSFVLSMAALLAASAPLFAQDYPARPLHFVVPYAAGGGGDIVARIVGQRLGNLAIELVRRRKVLAHAASGPMAVL